MDNPRILIFLHDSSLYGANLSLLNFCKELPSDYEITFIILKKGPICKEFDENGNHYKIIPFELWVYYYWESRNIIYSYIRKLIWFGQGIYKLLKNLLLILKQIKWFQKLNPSIIISNSSAISHGFLIAKILKIPHAWHLREFLDLDYSLKFYFGNAISKRIISYSDYTIATSKAVKAHFKIDKNCFVGYDGFTYIDSYDESKSKSQKHNHNNYIFSIVGLVSKNKGQEEAIRAFYSVSKEYPDIELNIVGGGNIDGVENLIDELRIKEKVNVIGYIHDTSAIYKKSNIILVCSKNEAMGRVTLEAMAHGTPVIGKNSGGTPELIIDGYNGFIYDNIEDLSNKMKYCINNRHEIDLWRGNCLEYIKEKFTIDKYVNGIIAFLGLK